MHSAISFQELEAVQHMMGHDSAAMAVARAMSETKEVDIQMLTDDAQLTRLDFTLQCER